MTMGAISDGSNYTCYVDNVAGTSVGATPTFASGGNISIFNPNPVGNPLNGFLTEMVIVKGAMSSTDRSNMAAYLLAKWGI